jgi:hypothetical protein
MKARTWPRLLALCAGLAVAAAGWAQSAAPAALKDEPVQLPVYTVTDSRLLPPPETWFYARVPGFEILSNASERRTRELVTDFLWFNQSLSLVWPAARLPTTAPIALILCGRGGKFDAFLAPEQRDPERRPVGVTLRTGEQAAIVVDARSSLGGLTEQERSLAVAGLLPDQIAAQGRGREAGSEDVAPRQLYREYIRFLLADTEPRAPLWFEEGLAQILMGIEVTRTSITVGKVADPNVLNSDPDLPGGGPRTLMSELDFNRFFIGGRLPPTASLFAVQRDPAGPAGTGNVVWSKHCQAFVHWGLYGDEGRHQKAFLTFLTRLGREPLTEALFQDCFKQNYTQMQETLVSYIEITRVKIAGVRTSKGERLPGPPALELREASEAEAARIHGDALRLAGNLAEARSVLATPYIRGDRDPPLLAALGLLERAAGDDGRARKFLEAAATGKVLRPRAHLELARMYFAEVTAHPAAPGGRLDADQTAAVLRPLFTALVQPPPLADVYVLVAETWARSAVSPAPQNIAVLDDGVRWFPRHAALVCATAEQKARVGLAAEAAALVTLGLKTVGADAALRGKLEALRATLPAPTPPAPAPR